MTTNLHGQRGSSLGALRPGPATGRPPCAEIARLSAAAAQARGRGEWMRAAQVAARIAGLQVEVATVSRGEVAPAPRRDAA